jgi:tetratricopeptide (TPR) repeat protein
MAKAQLDAAVGPLIKEGKYEQALDAVDEASFLAGPFKGGWQDKVLDNWHGRAQALIEEGNYARAEAMALRILNRFPEDEAATQILDKALAKNLPALLEEGQFPLALERLEQRGMPAEAVRKWRNEIETRWVAKAKDQIAKGKQKTALESVRAILTHFEGNEKARDLRNEALVGMLTPLVANHLKKEEPREALALIGRYAREMNDNGRKQLRRMVLDKLLGQIRQLRSQGQLAASQKACKLVLSNFKEGDDLAPKESALVHAILNTPPDATNPEFQKLLAEADRQIGAGRYEDALATLDKAYDKAANPDEQDQVRVQRTRARVGKIDHHLSQARRLYQGKAYGPCEKELQQAADVLTKLEGKEAEQKEKDIETWQALVWAVRPNAEKMDQAIDQFKKLVQDPVPNRLKPLLQPLCEAFRPVAEDWEKQPARAANAQAALKLAVAQLEEGKYKKKFQEFLVAVRDKSEKQKFFVLLQQAETDLLNGQKKDQNGFANCLEKLDRATDLARNDRAKERQVDELRALLYATGYRNRVPEGVRLLERLLGEKGLLRQMQLCQAFAGLAEREPDNYLEPALRSLGLVLGKSDPDREKVSAIYQKLIEDSVPRLQATAQWGKLLRAFTRGCPNGWALACKAECLLEQNSRNLEGKDLEDARTALADNRTVEAGAYGDYVRALVFKASNSRDESAKALARALQDSSKALRNPHRRDLAIELAQDLGVQLRMGGSLVAPFPKGNAALVFKLLTKARQLCRQAGKDLDDDGRINLALAAWYQEPADKRLGNELTSDLETKLGLERLDKNAIPLLLGRARVLARTAEDQDAALTSYERVMGLAMKALKQDDGTITPELVYREVAVPGLDLALKMSGAGIEARQAARYHQLGFLLRDYHDRLPADLHPLEESLKAYDQAVKLDPRAEYYTNRASTRRVKARAEKVPLYKIMDALKEDVAKALETADKEKYPGAYSFHGYLLETEALWQKEDRERKDYLSKALAAYRKAIPLFKGREDRAEEEPVIRMNSSIVAVELAHLEGDLRERKDLLDGAKTDAEKATEFSDHKWADMFWSKLGNVYEDKAWMLGEKGQYQRAITSFSKAAGKKDLPSYRLSLGRCYFRRAKSAEAQPTDLDEAGKAVKVVLARKDLNLAQEVEARYWLGQAYTLQAKNRHLAAGQFKQAHGLTKGQVSLVKWHKLVLIGWAQFLLDQAEALLAANRGAQVANLLTQVEGLANELAPLDAASAARLLGRIKELNNDPAEALDIYQKALAELAKDKKPLDYLLYLARLDLLIDEKFQAKLGDKKGDTQSILAQSNRAHELADDGSIFDPWERAQAYASAALARLDVATANDVSKEDAARYRKEARAWLEEARRLAPNHPKIGKWKVK